MRITHSDCGARFHKHVKGVSSNEGHQKGLIMYRATTQGVALEVSLNYRDTWMPLNLSQAFILLFFDILSPPFFNLRGKIIESYNC